MSERPLHDCAWEPGHPPHDYMSSGMRFCCPGRRLAVSDCTIHGWTPHRTGAYGSLTCEACAVIEDEYQARIARAREAS